MKDRAEVTEEELASKTLTEEPARTAIKTGGLVTSTNQVKPDSTDKVRKAGAHISHQV